MLKQKTTISVIGGSQISDAQVQFAQEVGAMVARVGAILVCGGLGGTMEAACRGAKEAGGTTIGLVPGKSKEDANAFVDIALPTTIGFARNAMVAASGHVVLALPGSHGTLSEICYALVYKRPVIDLGDWNYPGTIKVKDLKEAEVKIKELLSKGIEG